MKNRLKLTLLAALMVLGLVSINFLSATPVTANGSLSVSATVPFTLGNASGDHSMNPPALDAAGVTALTDALASGTGTSGGKITVTAAGVANQFSPYSNGGSQAAGGTPFYISSGTTAGAKLKGTGSNQTTVPYTINFIPCGGGSTSQDLTQCTGSASGGSSNCAFYSQASECVSNPGTVSYTYTTGSNGVPADTYSGTSTLSFAVGQ